MRLLTKTNKRTLLIIIFFICLSSIALGIAAAAGGIGNIAVLNPKGTIAHEQKNLLVFATLLSLIVVLPVYALTLGIVLKYRAGNKKAKYRPDWDGNRVLESVWWGIPLVLITILSVITWKSSHDLDPFKPLASAAKPVKIQVVSMNWKWLFIYPEEKIATVNYLKFPVDTPVDFQITGDSAMNSLWIPQLGGQIYAMPGMSTSLHLEAQEPGNYRGSSANISGRGFSGMKFTASATSQAGYERWLKDVKNSRQRLDKIQYEKLAQPSQDDSPEQYAYAEDGLYNYVMNKYLEPRF